MVGSRGREARRAADPERGSATSGGADIKCQPQAVPKRRPPRSGGADELPLFFSSATIIDSVRRRNKNLH